VALAKARELAAVFNASLGVITVVDPTPVLGAEMNPNIDLLSEMREEAQLALEKAVRGLTLKPAMFLKIGRPEYQIVDCATEWGASMIVVGTQGRTGLGRVFLGSVAEHVVRRAACTVVVAREETGKGA
jgi:nucleotide-binding universal stress UspA family protein